MKNNIRKPCMKKQKSNRLCEIKLRYLYTLASKLPYQTLAKSKCKLLLELAGKYQFRLKKAKLTICKSCKIVLIPKLNSTCGFEKKQNGLNFQISCSSCGMINSVVKQNKKRA